MKKLQISILIITRKYREADPLIQRVLALQSQSCDFEVLFGEGDNPSLQRNHLAEQAKGDYLLFLDDDSEPDNFLLSEYCSLVSRFPEGIIFGGPSLLKTNGSQLQKSQKIFFSSLLGIGPFRGRYNSIGKTRLSDEKELILSNILIQRNYFMTSGGFNKELYPGEENEFLNRHKNAVTIYCPETKIYRYPRNTFLNFLYQVFSYGKGRAKHLGLTQSELMFLLPAFFSIYMLFLLFWHNDIFLLPFGIYTILILSVIGMNARSSFQIYPLTFLIFLMGHIFYGFGLIVGILKRAFLKKSRRLSYMNIIRVKEFNSLINKI